MPCCTPIPRLLAACVYGCALLPVLAQSDTLWMSNGDMIVGELKEMTRGVMVVETDYSDSDLKLEWSKVRKVRTSSQYLVSFVSEENRTARLYSPDTGVVWVVEDDTLRTTADQIVYLKSVKNDFWSRASLGFDLGYNFTKAGNLQQFSLRSFVGYETDHWNGSATFDRVTSTQDDVADIQRTSVTAGIRRVLPHNWFAGVSASFLSNTEQKLDLRSSVQPGVGKYLARTNSLYLFVTLGAAFTNEVYTTEDPDRQSVEGLAAVEFNLFDAGDLSLYLASKAYPSFTEEGRWRMDHSLDAKYDLPYDIYIRAGFTLNYDNRPVAGASETDYVFQTAVGWSL